jgi:LysM repeat protein
MKQLIKDIKDIFYLVFLFSILFLIYYVGIIEIKTDFFVKGELSIDDKVGIDSESLLPVDSFQDKNTSDDGVETNEPVLLEVIAEAKVDSFQDKNTSDDGIETNEPVLLEVKVESRPECLEHIVKHGDTVYSIENRIYGKNKKIKNLVNNNIHIGQILTVCNGE